MERCMYETPHKQFINYLVKDVTIVRNTHENPTLIKELRHKGEF